MGNPILEVTGVGKRYRLGMVGATSLRDEIGRLVDRLRGRESVSKLDFWALRDVEFSLEAGAATGVIGRNGAGKSTLLKLISRITEPTTGEIRLRGRVGSLLEVGTGFHPELSGRDNVYLNGSILGMTRREISSKFDAIADFAEIGPFLDTPVKRYSSGMYVKLAFAVAAHLEPEILIVDEVLAVGDAAFQRKCIKKMQELATEGGRTVLFVSHNISVIRRLCSQCLYLEAGRSFGIMPTDEAIRLYSRNTLTSEFDVDTSGRKRDWGTDGSVCRIMRVRVPESCSLRFNEPLTVDFEVNAPQAVKGVALGLAFDTIEGQRIMTLDSDGGGRLFDLPAGRSVLSLSIPRLPLHPASTNFTHRERQRRLMRSILEREHSARGHRFLALQEVPSASDLSPAALCRRWACGAFCHGSRHMALRHALRALLLAPLERSSWQTLKYVLGSPPMSKQTQSDRAGDRSNSGGT
jgi:lipopolysaccharide transport system ATP-binding protein